MKRLSAKASPTLSTRAVSGTAANLIKWSTLISKISDGISEARRRRKYCKANRTALWLKDDKKLALCFIRSTGKRRPDASRSPKFMVDAGLDHSWFRASSIRSKAVTRCTNRFAARSLISRRTIEPRARLYLRWRVKTSLSRRLHLSDFPVRNNERYGLRRSESTAGISETYTQSDARRL